MKVVLLLATLSVSLCCFSQAKKMDFGLFFGNDFDSDSVTVLINGIQVATNIKLKPTLINLQNLIIEQYSDRLQVKPYRETIKTLKRIQLNNATLTLDISLNNIWRNFKFDLRKGKILLAEHSFLRIGWSTIKVFVVRQEDNVIMF